MNNAAILQRVKDIRDEVSDLRKIMAFYTKKKNTSKKECEKARADKKIQENMGRISLLEKESSSLQSLIRKLATNTAPLNGPYVKTQSKEL